MDIRDHPVRVDVWLWAARFFKTRSLAKLAIEGGKIEVNGDTCKPAKAIHVGDTIQVSRGEELVTCEVLGLAEKRGPASDAQKLYRESAASMAVREAERERRRVAGMGGGTLRPPTRPDKRARRQIQLVKDQM
jgi:ribosome-associated heat shock protein Hsp15